VTINAARTAVLALHLQRDIAAVDGALAAIFYPEVERTGVIGAVGRVLSSAREVGATVVYARVAYQAGYSDLIANSPLTEMVMAHGCLIDGTPGTEIVDQLAPRGTDAVVCQQRVSAFQSTQLDLLLRAAGIDTLALCGVATNVSVESTARAASDLGYRTIVVADACSAGSAAAHDAALESLSLLAEVTTVDGLLSSWTPAEAILTGKEQARV
jgi:biuret amidohydrolase